ncbi:restriction endonuclease subunit S [Photobacterium gaetbulicola]|uniref:restriction endonuclease subunit S n=1 Tax=Photobacterium gaetbulicola TaxID=1295392 RepID=UPI00068EB1AE|nr:restriction endonuclease subunit S [Photobacterium gaetbulicola]
MSNVVPEGWSEGALSDYALINPKLKTDVTLTDDTKVSFIKMEDVSNSARITKKHVRSYSEVAKGFTKFNDHDVLVAKITPCFENGKGGYADGLVNGTGFGSTEFHVLRAKGQSDSKYLYQYTNYDAFRLAAEASMCGTGGQRRVQTEFMKTHKVSFPPLPEQKKIAAILTSVDDVIEKTQAQIDKLKDLKTGMMQELLTRGVGVDGKPHTEFKDSPVGRIPKGWEVVPLSALATKIGDGIHSTPKYTDKSDYPFINGNNLKEGKVVIGSNTKYVSYEEYEKHRKELSDSTILMSINGTIGNLAYYQNEPVVLGKSAAYISVKNDTSKSYIYYVLSSDSVKKFYELELTGSTIRNLSLKAIRSTPIALPTRAEQEQIVRVLTSLDDRLVLLIGQLNQKQSLKKALMQDLLTGKVRVKVDR